MSPLELSEHSGRNVLTECSDSSNGDITAESKDWRNGAAGEALAGEALGRNVLTALHIVIFVY